MYLVWISPKRLRADLVGGVCCIYRVCKLNKVKLFHKIEMFFTHLLKRKNVVNETIIKEQTYGSENGETSAQCVSFDSNSMYSTTMKTTEFMWVMTVLFFIGWRTLDTVRNVHCRVGAWATRERTDNWEPFILGKKQHASLKWIIWQEFTRKISIQSQFKVSCTTVPKFQPRKETFLGYRSDCLCEGTQ